VRYEKRKHNQQDKYKDCHNTILITGAKNSLVTGQMSHDLHWTETNDTSLSCQLTCTQNPLPVDIFACPSGILGI